MLGKHNVIGLFHLNSSGLCSKSGDKKRIFLKVCTLLNMQGEPPTPQRVPSLVQDEGRGGEGRGRRILGGVGERSSGGTGCWVTSLTMR